MHYCQLHTLYFELPWIENWCIRPFTLDFCIGSLLVRRTQSFGKFGLFEKHPPFPTLLLKKLIVCVLLMPRCIWALKKRRLLNVGEGFASPPPNHGGIRWEWWRSCVLTEWKAHKLSGNKNVKGKLYCDRSKLQIGQKYKTEHQFLCD